MTLGNLRERGQFTPIDISPQPLLINRSPDTFLRLFLDEIQNGDAAFFGDAKKIIQYIPRERIKDTKLIHLSDRPIGINPFPGDANHILDAFRAVWDYNSPTPQLDMYLLTACLAMNEIPTGSLFHLHYLLTSPDHRKKIIKQLKDPVLKTHWEQFDKLSPKDQNDRTTSVTNRLIPLVTDPDIRLMIAQLRSVDTSGILIVDMPSSERYDVLAALLLAQVQGLAFIERPLIHIGASTPVIHTSYLHFLPQQLLERMLGTAVIISGKTGAVDAKVLEPHFNLVPGQFKLTELPEDQFHVRLENTLTLHTVPHRYKACPSNEKAIKQNTSHRHGSPKESVEKDIERFLSPKPPQKRYPKT